MAWVIPLGFLLLMIFGNYDLWKQEMDAVFADSTFTGILFLIMISMIALIAAAPFVVIWRAVTSTIKHSVVKNTTFNVLQDLDYYRDRFECVIALFLPLTGFLYLIAHSISKKYYKRTALGQELTEEIYGMKNFIHDFSELSHADKEPMSFS